MIPSKEEIERIACLPQHDANGFTNKEWRRARLGCFSSSKISELMSQSSEEKAYNKMLACEEKDYKVTKTAIKEYMDAHGVTEPQAKREIYESDFASALNAFCSNPFSASGMSYIYEVASERNIRKQFVDDDVLFDYYLQRVDTTTSLMRWGTEMEPRARGEYIEKSGNEVAEVGFIRHSKVDWLGDSPDGLILDDDGRPVGALEIKNPKPDTWMRYYDAFRSGIEEGLSANDILKDIKPEYYWQCQCHCACNDVDWCDFVFYDQMLNGGLYVVRIVRNQADIDRMYWKINIANKLIANKLTIKS